MSGQGRTVRRFPAGGSGSQAGFSMIEVGIVLIVALVLAAITYPSITGSMQLYRLETSAALIESKLADARINAIKRNRQVWLNIDLTEKSVLVQYNDGGTINLGAEEYLATGIEFVNPPTPAQITFDAQGWPTSAPETIRLRVGSAGSVKNITVSATGRVTIS